MLHSKEWYLSVLNSINDLILVKGEKSKLLWANKAFCDYYNMTNEELQNSIDGDHSDPDNTIQYVIDDQKVFTKGITLNIPSEPVTDGKGNVSFFHTIKNPIKNCSGEIVSTVGVSRLIEDEELLKRSKQLHSEKKSNIHDLRTFVENIPAPTIMLDPSRRIIASSNAWIECFNIQKNELIGADFDDLYEEGMNLKEKIIQSINVNEKTELDELLVQFNGKECFYKVVINPWELISKEVGGVMIMFIDITSQKEKEKVLEKHNEELKQFAYITTHDIKSPIVNIQSFLGFLESDEEIKNERSKQAIHYMGRSIEMAQYKINDLVKIIEQRELGVVNEDHLLRQVVLDIIEVYQSELVQINADVEIDIPNDLIIHTSIKQLTTILDNFISNAIRYRNQHVFLELIIQANRVENAIEISVSDNGVGIDLSKYGNMIFEMFKRANDSIPGNGLGLYLTKQSLSQLNADIQVSSEVGLGTVFTILIPQ
ncbi:PAS domain-containing sensor histidine kinase [Flammeovirga yaeyamensis]|uniref:histidine kinase n=1 Tax=Flammeovirga yaeyamensis TaxID=367791 RepID=A0AAX1N792_9BACT|nr:PAS domain-containing sensor histidine kinase [Flammeovirga yaeyamensis]MBB3697938.1 PAS domain S-box-containing protein [Flammeovirga yaeyamensis]NMF35707.1 PAS domain-containing protein [Flammeovirga yaeyamensis]QWG03340.1 PAS domain-containing sensor histidine kinase [Flammeovirga yaeyamensis]